MVSAVKTHQQTIVKLTKCDDAAFESSIVVAYSFLKNGNVNGKCESSTKKRKKKKRNRSATSLLNHTFENLRDYNLLVGPVKFPCVLLINCWIISLKTIIMHSVLSKVMTFFSIHVFYSQSMSFLSTARDNLLVYSHACVLSFLVA